MIRRGIGVQGFVSAGRDADAQAFITAAGITDATQQSAINTLVTDLKGYGIWTKMKAIYPFVGNTSSQMKYNLKDPRDLDAAFRIVFSGGWTFSNNGALPNGVNAYADTKFIPSLNSNLNNTHLSYYSRTNVPGFFQAEFGSVNSGNQRIFFASKWSTNDLFSDLFSINQRVTVPSAPNTTGLYTSSRTTSTQLIVYRNGSQIGNNNTADATAALPNISVFFGAFNNSGTPDRHSSKECAFASIGDGLTDTEAANLYTAVQAYQTTLSRNV